MSTDLHAIDDLVKALIKGDPNETVPLDTVTAMAEAAIHSHWIECPHTDFITYRENHRLVLQTCELCGARMVLEDTDA